MATDPVRRERFESLVSRAYVPLLRYLRRRTDPDVADDVLADTLLVLWRRIDDVPAEAELPWCIGVARGCLANAVRAKTRHLRLLRRLADEAVAHDHAADEGDPELDQAMQRLRPADREVLTLWAWDGLQPKDIAVVLGVSANAAGIRLHRAMARLRAELETGRRDGRGAGHLMVDKGNGTEGRGHGQGRG